MRIHKLLLAAGFDYNNFFRSVKKKNVERLIAQKLSREEYSGLLDQYDLSRHFAHEVLESEEDRLILKSSILDRIFFLKHCFSRTELDSDSFVDLGDPSGIFLKSLGKPGISFNISEDASRNARTNGMEVVRGTIDSLPFPGNSIDHVFLFQTLEHLHDPIGTLNKIYAVSRKSLTVSVPTVTNTLIHRSSYDPERRPYEHHIFEFSDRDLIKIISHTPYRIEKIAHSVLFDEKTGGITERLGTYIYNQAMKKEENNPEYFPAAEDMFYGSFKRLTLIHLRKP